MGKFANISKYWYRWLEEDNNNKDLSYWRQYRIHYRDVLPASFMITYMYIHEYIKHLIPRRQQLLLLLPPLPVGANSSPTKFSHLVYGLDDHCHINCLVDTNSTLVYGGTPLCFPHTASRSLAQARDRVTYWLWVICKAESAAPHLQASNRTRLLYPIRWMIFFSPGGVQAGRERQHVEYLVAYYDRFRARGIGAEKQQWRFALESYKLVGGGITGCLPQQAIATR